MLKWGEKILRTGGHGNTITKEGGKNTKKDDKQTIKRKNVGTNKNKKIKIRKKLKT